MKSQGTRDGDYSVDSQASVPDSIVGCYYRCGRGYRTILDINGTKSIARSIWSKYQKLNMGKELETEAMAYEQFDQLDKKVYSRLKLSRGKRYPIIVEVDNGNKIIAVKEFNDFQEKKLQDVNEVEDVLARIFTQCV